MAGLLSRSGLPILLPSLPSAAMSMRCSGWVRRKNSRNTLISGKRSPRVNDEFREQELYLSHLFEENQVILMPAWRENRVPIPGSLQQLMLFRLGDVDLFLSKLMRDDALDLADARFITERAGFDQPAIERAIGQARVPAVPELEEQFRLCAGRFLER